MLSGIAITVVAAGPAFGQSATLTPPPVHQTTDENGIDLFQGTMNASTPSMNIGADGDVSYQRYYLGNRYLDSVTGFVAISGTTYTVSTGAAAEKFTLSGATFTSNDNTGSTLTLSGWTYTFKTSDGTVFTFYQDPAAYFLYTGLASGIMLHTIKRPDGEIFTYAYRDQQVPVGASAIIARRLQSISSNKRHFLQLTYQYDTISSQGQIPGFLNLVKVAGYNLTTESCSPSANTCTASSPRPNATFSAPNSFTDAEGRTTLYTFGSNGLSAIRLPGSASDDVSVTYTSGKVSSVTTLGVATAYSYVDTVSDRTVTTTKAGASRIYKFDITSGLLTYFTDELGKTTHYEYTSGALTKATLPEGNATVFARDTRGNVTAITYKAKPGSGLADIGTSATFPCTIAAACNLPATTTDAQGRVTDYSYDASGNLTSVKSPAAVSGGDRPETRYTYTVSGGITALTGVSSCSGGTAPGCVGTTAEARTTIAYDTNFRPSTVTVAAGNGTPSATTTIGYDPIGNVTSRDGPLAGTGDTTTVEYDGDRMITATIGADPDGAGPRKRRAMRHHYDSRGLADTITVGTIDVPGGTFTASLVATSAYDADRRRISDAITAGGTVYSLTQYSYDAVGRPDCTAVRMNPATFASPPASACTAATPGSDGPDRIGRITVYDAAGRVKEVTSAYGTSDASVEKGDYTDNGKLKSVTDSENNFTAFTFDGFDRLSITNYPATAKGAGTSSGTDYEQLGYDVAGNVTSRRLRDGVTISYAYDNLNRLKTKTLPGTEPAVTYNYDLLGRLTGASTSLQSLSLAWDALGRQTGETGPLGTIGYQYDAAGNRTAITWPDSAVTTYAFDATNATSGIYEGSGTSTLMTAYGYDDLGRRTSMTTRYGASSGYSYDPVSRLSGLSQSFTTPANNLSVSFGYNSAGQTSSRTASNDSYAWSGAANADRTYTSNGLNQYGAAGSTSLSNDARGNLTASGSSTYGYSAENRLISAPGTTLSYDPLGRLYQVTSGSGTTRFQYIGDQIAAEYDGSNNRLRRVVPGAGRDEPAFRYEGAGIGAAKWYHNDERGSVVAISDNAGALASINSYDEYGIPAAGNAGRLQYTGQAYLPEIGLYYYKARIYSATLGRFMQADPIGYSDGLNWYNYTGSDPINANDPDGTDGEDIVVTGHRGCTSSDPNDIVVCGGGQSHPNGIDPSEYARYYGGPSGPPTSPPGNGSTGQGATAPQQSQPCNSTGADGSTQDRSNFFSHISELRNVASPLNVPEDFIVGLASYESGWLDVHNQGLHNLWGLTQAGGNNINFSSYAAGNAYFVSRIGPFIRNAQTVQQFEAGLKAEGYNSTGPNYWTTLADRIANIKKWEKRCGVK
jgi:RHS repeat-associated protein